VTTKQTNERRAATQLKQPRGPKGWPLIGNLLEARRDPLQFVSKLAYEYGDIARYRLGIYTGYLINHPDYIQYVLQLNHRNYSKKNYTYQMLKPVLGEGLLTSDGPHWLRERRLIQPAFKRKHLADFGTLMTTATDDMLDDWASIAAQEKTIDVAAEMTRLTLRIIGETLFGADIGVESDRIEAAFTLLNEDVTNRLKTVFVPPLWVPTPRNLAFRRARAELDAIVYAMIANRRQSGDPGTDLLSMLLTARDETGGKGMTDQQLRDEVMTLMLAGHETTATALTWTWYLLSEHPQVAQRMWDELDDVLQERVPTVDDLPALVFMKQVIQESLRLYPPVWIISRTAIDDDQIGPYEIPAGMVILLSQYVTHRHPRFWENPGQFDPDRFSPERAANRHQYAYFPFGGGPRLCIGDNLAMMEIQLILATIAQRYRLELVPTHTVEPEPLVTLRSRYGMQMRIHTRR
jgi:cytochrome P450